jgi:hypothetical protein
MHHATGNAQASQNGRKDSHNGLNNKFPSFFFSYFLLVIGYLFSFSFS